MITQFYVLETWEGLLNMYLIAITLNEISGFNYSFKCFHIGSHTFSEKSYSMLDSLLNKWIKNYIFCIICFGFVCLVSSVGCRWYNHISSQMYTKIQKTVNKNLDSLFIFWITRHMQNTNISVHEIMQCLVQNLDMFYWTATHHYWNRIFTNSAKNSGGNYNKIIYKYNLLT